MLKIQHLTKVYGTKKAVDDLSLHIQSGEIYGFIGHNGAGKTTTLKSVVGILQFDSGEIYINGKSIKEDPLGCKSDIAYIPDNPDLYDYMSGIKYLNFVADIFGINEKERNERIHKYADMFEITSDLADTVARYTITAGIITIPEYRKLIIYTLRSREHIIALTGIGIDSNRSLSFAR